MKNITWLILLIITLYFLSCKESEKSNNTSKLYSWTATVYEYKSGELERSDCPPKRRYA